MLVSCRQMAAKIRQCELITFSPEQVPKRQTEDIKMLRQ